MIWPFNIRLRKKEEIASAFPTIEKFGENLTPNMRALRLAMTVGDTMLSLGVPASRVVSRLLDITETYCKKPVHIDVSADIIMISQLRGVEKEPLTMIRPVVPRSLNNMTLQLVQKLVYDIKEGRRSLSSAESELDNILKNPITYPGWLVTCGNAMIAGGVSMMFSPNWRIWLLTFVIAVMVDRLVGFLHRQGISAFFRQVSAALFVTIAAALISFFAKNGVEFFAGIQPTLIVVGGIVMLVAGLLIVGAIQDAIEEYYVTANARILKVILMTIGIVVGVIIGLYIAGKLGMGINVLAEPLHLNTVGYQIVGAFIAAAGFAIGTQTRMRAVAWAGIVGAFALIIMYTASVVDISIVPASGVAAVFIGLIATIFSRRWRTPSTGIVAAGILPLVPGLALFNGLMLLSNNPPSDPLFDLGMATLFTAIATALAIAVGASFGSMLARPLHHQATHTRNVQPFANFMIDQLVGTRRHRFSSSNIMRSISHIWNTGNDKNKPKL